jgi:hypothetical protein
LRKQHKPDNTHNNHRRKEILKVAQFHATEPLMHEEQRQIEQDTILRDAQSIISGIVSGKISYEIGIEAHRHNMRIKRARF